MKRRPAIFAMLVVLVALAGAALLGQADSAQAAQTTIEVGDFWFCDSMHSGSVCETTISQGDTVVWSFGDTMATHTTTGSIWDSGNINRGGTFSFTFNDAGSYEYHCNIHATLMMGRIVVQAAPAPTATSPLSGGHTPAAAPTRTSGGVPTVVLPTTGQGPSSGASGPWWLLAAVAAAGVALSGLGALAYTRRRS